MLAVTCRSPNSPGLVQTSLQGHSCGLSIPTAPSGSPVTTGRGRRFAPGVVGGHIRWRSGHTGGNATPTRGDKHGPEIGALNLCAGHSAAVPADLLDGNPNAFPVHVPPSGLRGGCAVGLGRLRGVYPVQSDRDGAPNRPPDVESVPVCDVHNEAAEGLPRLYRGALSGKRAGGGKQEKSGKEVAHRHWAAAVLCVYRLRVTLKRSEPVWRGGKGRRRAWCSPPRRARPRAHSLRRGWPCRHERVYPRGCGVTPFVSPGIL